MYRKQDRRNGGERWKNIIYERRKATTKNRNERDALLRSLKENLQSAQHRMEQKVNAHRCELELVVGDLVLVRPQPYR